MEIKKLPSKGEVHKLTVPSNNLENIVLHPIESCQLVILPGHCCGCVIKGLGTIVNIRDSL